MNSSLSTALKRKKALTGLLGQVAALPLGVWCIEDHTGQLIFGTMPDAPVFEQAVIIEHEMTGCVKGQTPENVAFLSGLIEQWLRQEAEKKQLGAETLQMYREINLIFSFSEKLANALDATAVARLLLQEVGQIISFDAGGVFLIKQHSEKLHLSAAFNGENLEGLSSSIIQQVIGSGKAAISVAPLADDSMLLCAPLCFGQEVLGGLILIGATFTAADLKLAVNLAAQAAASVENVLQHEVTTAQALKEQRERLTLELAQRDPFFKRMMSVIETRFNDASFSVDILAEALHLSVSQLQRKINAVTDLTPVEIIRSVRLARAKELLQSTDLNVSEVAFRAGFNDPSYFTRLFVKELLCTPSVWREKARRQV